MWSLVKYTSVYKDGIDRSPFSGSPDGIVP